MKLIYVLLGILLICRWSLAAECYKRVLTPSSQKDGYISSPNYPDPYPPNVCLIWFVYNGSPHLHVVIRIIDLDIPVTNFDKQCSGDRLTFGPLEKQVYCGRIRDKKYLSDQRHYFSFVFNSTNSYMKGKGFVLHYIFTTDYRAVPVPTIPTSYQTTTTTTTEMPRTTSTRNENVYPTSHHSCSSVITSNKGQIVLFPPTRINIVDNAWSCSWLLKPKMIPQNGFNEYQLRFTVFHLYPRCYVEIYEGEDEMGQLQTRLTTDPPMPQEFHIFSDPVFIKLTVPADLLSEGFIGNFTLEYERKVQCKTDYKHCGFNETACYFYEKRCDGVWDCPVSGGDERGCSYKCPGNSFSCRDKLGYCYSYADRCNGKGTCINYKDEENCPSEMCHSSKGLFLCKNRHCIYEKWVCDGSNDCADGSDEEDCGSWTSPRIIMAAVVGSVLCSLLLVIALSFACRVYALHNHRHRGETGHETALSRLEAELLRQRAPPPPYREAMLTSRPYEEAYLELLNNGSGGQITAEGPRLHEQDSSQSSLRPADIRQEQASTGNRRHQRRRRRQRHRNIQHSAAASGGILSSANQRCQLLLHRAGLAPPPYSLIDASVQAEDTSSDSDSNCVEGVTRGTHNEPLEMRDEDPSAEISSLSSSETPTLSSQYQSLSLAHPETSLSPMEEIVMEAAEAGDSLLDFNLITRENCDKETDDSSESSDANAETEVLDAYAEAADADATIVETSLSSTNATEGEIPIAGCDNPEDAAADDDDSDDCQCILAEGNDFTDESRISADDLDSGCILNGQKLID